VTADPGKDQETWEDICRKRTSCSPGDQSSAGTFPSEIWPMGIRFHHHNYQVDDFWHFHMCFTFE
jgi:hypothetical protein